MGDPVEAVKIKIRVRRLRRVFPGRRGPVEAIRRIDLDVRDGEFVVIVGPSGCGKSTFLRILAGLDRPTGGEVEIARTDPTRPLNSMVFQQESVLPWLTVRQNIEYGLRMRRVPKAERRRIVDRYLEVANLSRFEHAFPYQLSGGMKQRTSVARAFANDPEILLMDEPFASLDEQTKLILQGELLRIWSGSDKTVCYITHSIEEAINLGDRIVVLTAHPGRIKAIIDVDIPRPRDVVALRKERRFHEIFDAVWGHLREEVDRSFSGAGPGSVTLL